MVGKSLLTNQRNPVETTTGKKGENCINDFINRIPVFPTTTLPSIQMWSVDVKDMYQNIEHDLGLEAIEFWLDRYPEMIPKRISKKCILEALLFVLENNSGYFDGSFYRQIRETATGIKPAP